MIKVLHVIDGLNAGGMESMLMNYYRNLDKNNINFDFLVFHKEKGFFEDDVLSMGGKVFKVTPRRENFIKNRKEVRDFFKNNSYDIVEFHQGITYFYPLIMAKRFGNKIIIHNHGINRNYLKIFKFYNEIYAKKRISSLATNYFTCSEEVNNQLFSNYVIKNKKISLISNAIDVKIYKFNLKHRKEIRREFNIKEDIELLCHVGTFTIPKNHEFLLNVYYEYLKLSEKSRLLLVGEGALKDDIIKKAINLGIQEKIIFAGNRKDVYRIFSAADKLIFPSLYEGIPLVLIEAQSSGLPIFISDTINSKSFVTNNGMILKLNESAKEWAKEIFHYSPQKNRLYYNGVMKNSQYNIVSEEKKLEKLYIDMLGEKKYEKNRHF